MPEDTEKENENNPHIEKLKHNNEEEKNAPSLLESNNDSQMDESDSSFDDEDIAISNTRAKAQTAEEECLKNLDYRIEKEPEPAKTEEMETAETELTETKEEMTEIPTQLAVSLRAPQKEVATEEDEYEEEEEDDGTADEQVPVERRRYLYIDYSDLTVPKFSREEQFREGQIHWYLRKSVLRRKNAHCFDLWEDLRKNLDEYEPVMKTIADVENFVIDHPHCFNYKDEYIVSNQNTGTWMYFPSVIHLIHSKSRGGQESVCLAEIFRNLRQLPDSFELEALNEDLYFWEGRRPANCTDILRMLFLRYPSIFEVHEEPAEGGEENDIKLKEGMLLTKQMMYMVKQDDASRKKRIFIRLKPFVYTIPSFWYNGVFKEFDPAYHVDKSRQYGLTGTISGIVKDKIVLQIDYGFLNSLRALGKIDEIGIPPEQQKMISTGIHLGVKVIRNYEGEHGLKILSAVLDTRARRTIRRKHVIEPDNNHLSSMRVCF